jgi:methionyl-tRNA synthetase
MCVVSAISTDHNQSYVVTTAERLGRDPYELAVESHAEVARTLRQASISFDLVGRPDEDYSAFVSDHLRRLGAAGAFVEREVDSLYDARTGRHLVESYVGGRCPVCFLDTRGNICESCGHPNDPRTLVRPYVVGGGEGIETERGPALVLPLEPHRAALERHYAGRRLRPALRVLIDSLLERPLPDFPITYRSDWGLPARLPSGGGAVYNVWAEMYPGHLHWTRRAQAAEDGESSLWEVADDVRYVQFIGFDNSFFYAVAHVAMGLAASAARLPAAPPADIVTNQFYLLENAKFSTSQGHLIWARDLLAEWQADPVRLYLCLSNPETQESNFTVDDMRRTLEAKLVGPFERVRRAWNWMVAAGALDTAIAPGWAAWQQRFRERFERFYEPATFSLRGAAATFTAYLELLDSELELAGEGGAPGLASAMGHLALYAAPLMPGFSERLAEHLGLDAPPSWSTPPVPRAAGMRPIPSDLLTLRRAQPVEPGR